MLRRTMAWTVSLMLAATSLSAQVPGMRQQQDGMSRNGMSGMTDEQMMMGGMMGSGMMGSGMMQMMGQGVGMMATGGPGPAAILRMGDALGLTDEQTTRLQEIRNEHQSTAQQHMAAAMSSHQAAQGALEGDSPDFQAYEDALTEVSRHMVQAHVAMARASAEARDVLTPEQRDQLQEGMQMMQGMMGGPGMGGGMQNGAGGMMRGNGGAMPHGGDMPDADSMPNRGSMPGRGAPR